MARTSSPWFWEERNGWYVNKDGQRHFLGEHPTTAPPPRKIKKTWNAPPSIVTAFHVLMAAPVITAVPDSSSSADGPSVAEILDKYLDWCQKHRAPRTYEWYRDLIQGFLDALSNAAMAVTDLKPFHIIEWVDQHPNWSQTSKRQAIIGLQRPLNWAEELGYIAASPIKRIKKPQPQRRDNPMSPDAFAALLALVKQNDPFRDLLLFMWYTGCRPQEARHVEGRHVQLAAQCVVIPKEEAKGKRRIRVILLHGPALEIVTRLVQDHAEGKLFRNARGNPWKRFAISNRFDRLKKKLGKRFAAYDLRHGFCQRLLESGTNHLAVAELMGHATGRMVAETYSHMNRATDYLKEALKKADEGCSP